MRPSLHRLAPATYSEEITAAFSMISKSILPPYACYGALHQGLHDWVRTYTANGAQQKNKVVMRHTTKVCTRQPKQRANEAGRYDLHQRPPTIHRHLRVALRQCGANERPYKRGHFYPCDLQHHSARRSHKAASGGGCGLHQGIPKFCSASLSSSSGVTRAVGPSFLTASQHHSKQ